GRIEDVVDEVSGRGDTRLLNRDEIEAAQIGTEQHRRPVKRNAREKVGLLDDQRFLTNEHVVAVEVVPGHDDFIAGDGELWLVLDQGAGDRYGVNRPRS